MYLMTCEHQGHMTKSNTPTCKRVRKLSETEPAKISSKNKLPPKPKSIHKVQNLLHNPKAPIQIQTPTQIQAS